jgi:hypothetical protein
MMRGFGDFSTGDRILMLVTGAAVSFLALESIIGMAWTVRLFQWGWLLFVAATISHWVYGAAERIAHRSEIRKKSLRMIDRKLAKMDRENERLRTITLESMGNFLNVDVRTGKAEAHFRPVSPHRLTVNQSGGPDAAGIGIDGPAQSPVPILANADHCLLFYGGRGRGKTVLVQNCLAAAGADAALILDPKPMERGKWPPWARVVGSGYQYQDIDAAIRRLNENITRPAGRFLLVVDEINAINQNLPDFANHWTQALEVGREHGKAVWIVGQSKTAKGLGLQGSYDLLTNFDYLVGAKWKRSTDERWVEIEEEGEETLICPPPPMFPGFGNGAGPAAYQSGGTTEGDFVDAEFSDAGGAGPDAQERDGKGGGTVRRVAGLLGFHPRPKGATKQTDAILKALHKAGKPMAPAEVAEAAKLDKAYTRQALRRMLKAKQVASPERGRYAIND